MKVKVIKKDQIKPVEEPIQLPAEEKIPPRSVESTVKSWVEDFQKRQGDLLKDARVFWGGVQ